MRGGDAASRKRKKRRSKKFISHQSKLWYIRSISMGWHVFTTSQCAAPMSLYLLLCVIITPCWISCKFQVQAILISSGSISLYKTTAQSDTIFPLLSGPLFLAALSFSPQGLKLHLLRSCFCNSSLRAYSR